MKNPADLIVFYRRESSAPTCQHKPNSVILGMYLSISLAGLGGRQNSRMPSPSSPSGLMVAISYSIVLMGKRHLEQPDLFIRLTCLIASVLVTTAFVRLTYQHSSVFGILRRPIRKGCRLTSCRKTYSILHFYFSVVWLSLSALLFSSYTMGVSFRCCSLCAPYFAIE